MALLDNPFSPGVFQEIDLGDSRAVHLRCDNHGRVSAIYDRQGDVAEILAAPVTLDYVDAIARHVAIGNPEFMTRAALQSLAVGFLTLAAWHVGGDRD
jgi:hypothetical protein